MLAQESTALDELGACRASLFLSPCAYEVCHVWRKPSCVTNLKVATLPIDSGQSPATHRGTTVARKLDEGVGITHRIVERDGLAGMDGAKRNERVRAGEPAVGIATVVDEVHLAEIFFIGMEKPIDANLEKLMTLLGRERQGISGGYLRATPDRNGLAPRNCSLGDDVSTECRVVHHPQARNCICRVRG